VTVVIAGGNSMVVFFGVSNPFPPPRPSIFSDYFFLFHHPVKQDDRQLLAHAVASDLTVTWQFFLKRTREEELEILYVFNIKN
jgi:hypothetical protein